MRKQLLFHMNGFIDMKTTTSVLQAAHTNVAKYLLVLIFTHVSFILSVLHTEQNTIFQYSMVFTYRAFHRQTSQQKSHFIPF